MNVNDSGIVLDFEKGFWRGREEEYCVARCLDWSLAEREERLEI